MTEQEILNAKLECLKAALSMNHYGEIEKLMGIYRHLLKEMGLSS